MTLMGARAGVRDLRVFVFAHTQSTLGNQTPALCLNLIHRVHRYSSAPPIARVTFEAPWPVDNPSASSAITCHLHLPAITTLTCSTPTEVLTRLRLCDVDADCHCASFSMPLPMPGSPAASWAVYRARLKAVFDGADPRVCAAFWLF
ncbi:battenin CLN3 protein, partial [Curvularia kusanoi]